MTDEEVLQGMDDGSIDTRRWDDALAVGRNMLEDDDFKILRAWDVGTHWLFDVGVPPLPGEIRWGYPWPSDYEVPTPIWALEKGEYFPCPLLANDDLLKRDQHEVSLVDVEV